MNDIQSPASTEDTTSADAGGNAGNLASLLSSLTSIGTALTDAGKEVTDLPGLKKLAGPLSVAGETISTIASRIQSVSDAVKEGSESGGAIGGLLSGASAALGESNGPNEDGETSSLDKVREKVASLSEIWTKYYDDLRDKDGKLKADKLANLALEVGETILGSKKMAKVRKVLAIANVIRNNAEAITKAATSLPPPFNAPLIAAMTALGVKQLASVKGQAHDGLSRIPSTGTYLLEKGERVVGKRLNQDLSGFLQGINGDGSSTNLDRSVTNRSNSFNPTINMTIGSDASPDAVFANRGALENMIREIYADYAQEAPFGA